MRTSIPGLVRHLRAMVFPMLFLAGCTRGTPPPPADDASSGPRNSPSVAGSALALTSSAFADGGALPTLYTCDGDDISPPLAWSGVPEGARSLVVLCDDPDAPQARPWVHWVLFDLPPEVRELPAAVPKTPELPDGSRQGVTDFGGTGYGGPCPPRGAPHHYIFQLYALDTRLALSSQVRKQDLAPAMTGHVLAQTQLVATYQRP